MHLGPSEPVCGSETASAASAVRVCLYQRPRCSGGSISSPVTIRCATWCVAAALACGASGYYSLVDHTPTANPRLRQWSGICRFSACRKDPPRRRTGAARKGVFLSDGETLPLRKSLDPHEFPASSAGALRIGSDREDRPARADSRSLCRQRTQESHPQPEGRGGSLGALLLATRPGYGSRPTFRVLSAPAESGVSRTACAQPRR